MHNSNKNNIIETFRDKKLKLNLICAQMISLIFSFLGAVSLLHAEDLPANSIITVAGGSLQGYNGDQIEAAKAALNLPMGVASSRGGLVVYISDTGNHRVRMVDLEYGDISTIAGNGSDDFRGDGGLATNASLKSPAGIAVDMVGSVYIADRGNHRIRKVDSEGLISTVAGSSKPGFSGDGGVATQATLKDPIDVAVDALGNLYISDFGNSRIRLVDSQTGKISTIAGDGGRRFNGDGRLAMETGISPSGIAVDGSGGLLVADMRNHCIRKIDLESNIITTIAGSGRRGFIGDGELALGARFNSPSWIALSAVGDIFVSDAGNNRIRKIDAFTDIVTTVAGTGNTGFDGESREATSSNVWSPYGISIDERDNIYVADYLNNRVRRINLRKERTIDFKPRNTTSWLERSLWAGIPTSLGFSIWWFWLKPKPTANLPEPPAFPTK
jgi:sugar lactone lactonase YvrE